MKQISDLNVGDRFLAENMTRDKSLSRLTSTVMLVPLPNISIFTVTERTPTNIIGINASGVQLTLSEPYRDAYSSNSWKVDQGGWNLRQLSTYEKLPTGDDDQVSRYLATRINTNPTLFHIDSVDGAQAFATLVDRGPTSPTDAELNHFSAEWTGESNGYAHFYAEPIRLAFDPALNIAPGDLITAAYLRCDVSSINFPGELITTVIQAIVIGSFPDRAAVAAFCAPSIETPTEPPPKHSFHIDTSCMHFENFATERHFGLARAEPSEALVIWYCPDEDKKDKTTCHFFGHTGIDFLIHEDGIEDIFYKENITPGLYLAFNAHAWSDISYEGEHESGIETDWRPATAEDIERFGFTMESFDAEIADSIEIDNRPGLTEEFMKAATWFPSRADT